MSLFWTLSEHKASAIAAAIVLVSTTLAVKMFGPGGECSHWLKYFLQSECCNFNQCNERNQFNLTDERELQLNWTDTFTSEINFTVQKLDY